MVIIRGTNGTGQCDARCYNAQSPQNTCKCVCRGENHGVGLIQAIRNNNRHVGALLSSGEACVVISDMIVDNRGHYKYTVEGSAG